VGELLARAGKMWWTSNRPTTAWASASRLARSFRRAHTARAWLSVSPLSSRCKISRAAEAAHVGDDGGELAIGILQHGLQPVGEPRPLGREATRWMR
jgi:hypothetical protein